MSPLTTAVVTGIGVVAPNGVGTETCWSATLAGHSGIRPITRFDPAQYPVTLAGEVPDGCERVPSRLAVQTDRWTHLAFTATELALADAAVDPEELPEYEMAVVTASSSGGTEFGQREIERLWRHGPRHVGAYQSIAWFYAATTGQLSIRHGMRGPCGVVVSEQAGGVDAIGHARRILRDGSALVVTGGTDSALCPYGLVAQLSTGRLSTGTDPATAYRPFASDARGYVPGEGGAILVMESAEGARARGAPQVYGEVAGYAATFDPPPGSTRPPTLRRAVELALADAGVTPEDVDVVFADAAGVPELDRVESAALVELFGPYGVPVTAPKTMTGRLYGGAALDTATALLSIRDNVVPPTVGVTEPARDQPIDLVRGAALRIEVNTALVVARGHGGMNAALVVTAPRPRHDPRQS